MVEIKLNFEESIEQNNSRYFNQIKKLKSKIKGAESIIEKTKHELSQKEKIKEKEITKHEKEEILRDRKKYWYEKFRWFFSSTGFLCIGGRDATSNEIIIKKHTDPNDIVFHTEMAGSPFFVIKSENKDIDEQTIQECANATLIFSSAWKAGLSDGQVFYITPEQISKQANPGEYISKGSFMIKGKKNFINPKIDFAVGEYNNTAMSGPLTAIKNNCEKYVEVIQGKEKANSTAKKIKKEVNATIDDIIRVLPTGGYDIKKKRK
jgi:predicted ribosome quality control (RQC) complex YloA/Tae2 family protein